MTAFRQLLVNFLLIVAGTALAILITEGAYRAYLALAHPLVTVTPAGEVLNPGGSGVYPTGGFVTLDRQALRNGFDPEPATRSRQILVIGDSLTFGTGVGDRATFVSLLNDAFRDRDIGFVNVAVPGYNTAHLRSLLAHRLEEDAAVHGVVWVYNVNDARTSYDYLGVQYTDGSLMNYAKAINPHRARGGLARLNELTWPRLRSVTFLTHLAARYLNGPAREVDWPEYFAHCLAAYQPDSPSAANEAMYLKEITSWLQRRKIPLWFALAPTANQFRDGQTAPQEFVRAKLAQEVPVLDLLERFNDLEDIDGLYQTGDPGHWNETGHRLAAGAIAGFLETQGLH